MYAGLDGKIKYESTKTNFLKEAEYLLTCGKRR
jgi:hypothetical protein